MPNTIPIRTPLVSYIAECTERGVRTLQLYKIRDEPIPVIRAAIMYVRACIDVQRLTVGDEQCNGWLSTLSHIDDIVTEQLRS